MPDKFTQRTKPKNLKEWLAHLGKPSDEEYARTYLTGEETKVEKTTPDKNGSTLRADLPAPESKPGFFKRITLKLRGSGGSPKDKATPVNGNVPLMDDTQVDMRLTGEESQPVPSVNPLFVKPRVLSPAEPELPLAPEPQGAPPLTPSEYKTLEGADIDQLHNVAADNYETVAQTEAILNKSIFYRFRKWFDRLPMLPKIALVLGVLIVIVVGAILIVFKPLQSLTTLTTPTFYVNTTSPLPASLTLPGGQSFTLGVGMISNGKWSPKGAEWLGGTEVPRWLAIPWDKNLETSVLAYQVDAPIQLKMSNGDVFVYRFQSVAQITDKDMTTFHANTADLLIVLSKPGTSTRSVIVAIP